MILPRDVSPLMIVLALATPLTGCGLHGRPKVERRVARADGTGRAPAPLPAAESRTERPAAGQEPPTVVAPGIVEAWGDSLNLSAQESGWIAQLQAREGEQVQAGQLLAALEDSSQRHAVELARAELMEAEAILARIERGPTAEELTQARADAEAARARGDLARSGAARTARLRAEQAVSEAEGERAADEARAEQARARGAEARLAEVQRGARTEDRAAAHARAAAARARLSLAEASLARRRVVAPASGTVLLSRFHVGEFYPAGSGPFFVLGDLTRLQVRLEVDEIDAQEIDPGSACVLYSDGGVRLAEGTILRLAPKMGRRALPIESPTARADVRVREVLVELSGSAKLVPGQRVWGHTPRGAPPQVASAHLGDRP
jgi:HlyD family secretion protein